MQGLGERHDVPGLDEVAGLAVDDTVWCATHSCCDDRKASRSRFDNGNCGRLDSARQTEDRRPLVEVTNPVEGYLPDYRTPLEINLRIASNDGQLYTRMTLLEKPNCRDEVFASLAMPVDADEENFLGVAWPTDDRVRDRNVDARVDAGDVVFQAAVVFQERAAGEVAGGEVESGGLVDRRLES